MEEIWKDILGYEEKYQVSNYGNIKALSRKVNTKGCSVRIIKERILKIYKGYRYQVVYLGRRNSKSVHKLVALAFVPNPHNKPQINHIDGNKQNNNADNLEWCTQSENQLHAYKIGLQKPFSLCGENAHNAIRFDIYDRNGNYLSTRKRVKTYADEIGVNPGMIFRVLCGRRKYHRNLSYRYAQ